MVVVEVEAEAEPEPPGLIVVVGRWSEWDRHLGRVRLGYDVMDRIFIRVRCERDERYWEGRVGERYLTCSFRRTSEGGSYIKTTQKGRTRKQRVATVSASAKLAKPFCALAQSERSELSALFSHLLLTLSFSLLPWISPTYFVPSSSTCSRINL